MSDIDDTQKNLDIDKIMFEINKLNQQIKKKEKKISNIDSDIKKCKKINKKKLSSKLYKKINQKINQKIKKKNRKMKPIIQKGGEVCDKREKINYTVGQSGDINTMSNNIKCMFHYVQKTFGLMNKFSSSMRNFDDDYKYLNDLDYYKISTTRQNSSNVPTISTDTSNTPTKILTDSDITNDSNIEVATF